MTTRRVYVLLLPIMIVILTGCFRQASEPVQPLNESLSDQRNQATSQPVIEATATETNGDSLSVSTSTPVQQVATATPPPTETPVPLATESSDGTGITGPIQMESPSPTFITPISSNQSAISTATPRSTESIEATPTDLVSETDTCTYVIQRGDTLYRIALAHNLTVDEVVAANPGINPSLIIPGDELVIPDCEPDAEATPEAAGENITTVGSPGEVIHTVVAGDTLLEIAKQYGVTIASIVDANNLADPNRLSVGQELIIPPPESP